MSYEVYIDITHHPKHCDDFEKKISRCWKLGDRPELGDDEGKALVAYALRDLADELWPDEADESANTSAAGGDSDE